MNVTSTQNPRYYDLDALRSILMSLGIILHSANVFSPDNWAIQNSDTSVFFTWLVDFIHAFRMPAFFIVSGFFVHFTYVRKGYSVFITQRIPRILIPLFVTALTLNTLQFSLLNDASLLLSSNYWISGKWVSHLWFLNCLLYYFIGFTLIMVFFSKSVIITSHRVINLLDRSKGLYLLLLPLISILFIKMSYLIPEFKDNTYDLAIPESIKYLAYFLYGILLGQSPKLYKEFISTKTTLILLLCVVISFLIENIIEHKTAVLLANYFYELSLTWFLCSLIFNLFHRFLNFKSVFFLYMADASYTIYLFHHIFVIALSILIIQIKLPIYIKFILLITSTFILSNIIHYFFIQKFSLLRFLYNGKKLKN